MLLSLLILILFADGSLMTSSDASEFADDASCTASFLSDEGDSAVFVYRSPGGLSGGPPTRPIYTWRGELLATFLIRPTATESER